MNLIDLFKIVFNYLNKSLRKKKLTRFQIADAFKIIEENKLKDFFKRDVNNRYLIPQKDFERILEEFGPKWLLKDYKKNPSCIIRLFHLALNYEKNTIYRIPYVVFFIFVLTLFLASKMISRFFF